MKFVITICLSASLVSLAYAAPAAKGPDPDQATIATDESLVNNVQKAMQAQGYAAISAHLADLEAVIDRAPPPQAPSADVVYFPTTSAEDCLIDLAVFAAKSKEKAQAAKRAVCVPNPYPKAAALIGAYYDEVGQPARALEVLDRAMRRDPDFMPARVERGAALVMLRRFDEALENDQYGLAHAPLSASVWDKGMLLRGEGFVLTELGRLDEAESAYRDALKIDPNHGNAAHELIYIERLRQGSPKAASVINSALNPKPH